MSVDPTQKQNTYVIDAESSSEMARLIHQDHLMTKNMGGLFPSQLDLSTVHDVLDIACGPGGWVLEVAYAHPEMHVSGIDLSSTMIQYAQKRAQTQQLRNVEFRIMDVLKPLAFSDNAFDFVNARTIVGFMLPSSWPVLLQECMRITRPGGTIRLTELELNITNSPANEKMNSLIAMAGYLSRRSFSPDGRHIGITPMLGRFLREAGCEHIEHQAHVIDFSSGTDAHEEFFQDMAAGMRLLQPFLIKLQVATQEEIDQLYQQALTEVQSEDFSAVMYFLSVWGQKP